MIKHSQNEKYDNQNLDGIDDCYLGSSTAGTCFQCCETGTEKMDWRVE